MKRLLMTGSGILVAAAIFSFYLLGLYHGRTGHPAQIRAAASPAYHAHGMGNGPWHCFFFPGRSTADEPGLLLLPGLGGRRAHVQRGDFHRPCRNPSLRGSGHLAILDRRPADSGLRYRHEPVASRGRGKPA